MTWKETDDIAEAESAAGPVVQRPKMNATVTESTFSLLNVAESGRFKAERSCYLAKKGNVWAHAASAGTGTDPLMVP